MTALLDPRNGEAYDLPPPAGPPWTWMVASVPRSGSTLLCRSLWEAGGAGAPKEYLNPMQLRDWQARLGESTPIRVAYGLLRGRAVALARGTGWSKERLARHLDRVRRRRSDVSGRFGVKIHYHHFERWFLRRGWSVDELLSPASFVRITRNDRVAQAVSWARALQTGRWSAEQRGGLPAIYLSRQIDRLIDEIARQEAGWDAFFAERGVRPLCVTYEELVADVPATTRRVLAHLGVSAAAVSTVADPSVRRQADETSARWAERYRAARGLPRAPALEA